MISDPYLRQIIQRAIQSGNTSLAGDLNPDPQIKRFTTPPFNPGQIADTNPLPGGTPAPRGPMPSILDRALSGVYVPQMPPTHGYEKHRASRSALAGFMGAIAKNHGGAGYGSGILKAAGGDGLGDERLAEAKRYHDMMAGDRQTDNERFAAYDKWRMEHGDNALGETTRNHDLTHDDRTRGQDLTHGDRVRGQDLSHGDRQEGFDVTRRGQDLTNSRGWANIGLAREREARRGQVAAMYPKWSPQMKMEHDAEVRQAFTLYKDDPDARDIILDDIERRYLHKSQQIGNPFQDPYLPNAGPVQTGHSSTATGSSSTAPAPKGKAAPTGGGSTLDILRGSQPPPFQGGEDVIHPHLAMPTDSTGMDPEMAQTLAGEQGRVLKGKAMYAPESMMPQPPQMGGVQMGHSSTAQMDPIKMLLMRLLGQR